MKYSTFLQGTLYTVYYRGWFKKYKCAKNNRQL